MATQYSIYHPQILDRLKRGGPRADGKRAAGIVWFQNTIAESFDHIARANGCEVDLSHRRLEEAHELWLDDVNRTRLRKRGEPDHFKQVGFLVHWLRRRVVVNNMRELPQGSLESERQEFLRYGNEKASFLFGFRLCLGYGTQHLDRSQRLEALRNIRLPTGFRRDVAILLQHKQVSPHALYLIYRSLFLSLNIPPTAATAPLPANEP